MPRPTARVVEALTAFPRTTIAAGVGLVFGLCFFGWMTQDYREYRDVPRERASVVSVVAGTGEVGCGKRSVRPEFVTWRSATARPGYPAQSVSAECPGTWHVGDVDTLARHDPGVRPALAHDPFDSYLGPSIVGIGTGALGFGIALFFQTRPGADRPAAWLTRVHARHEQARRAGPVPPSS